MAYERIVIIGAGHAGGAMASSLRQSGYAGHVTLIGEEDAAPYQRPPLSKAYLKGETDLGQLTLRDEAYYVEQKIDWRRASMATAISRTDRTVTLKGGERLAYGGLVLATGRRARSLNIPGADLSGSMTLRTAADADRLRSALGPGVRLVIAGGGYVGLEVAASARSLGCEVVLVEREPRLLARVASEDVAAFFHARHEAAGVRLLTGRTIRGFESNGSGAVAKVGLDDGRQLPCDLALVGIGAIACDELGSVAGLECADGIVVDADGRTSDPDIFAVGDVTVRRLQRYGGAQVRLESVPSALELVRAATAAIMGQARPAEETPWFWSDQYDVKLQIAGLTLAAEHSLTRGNPSSGRFAVFHLRGDQVEAVEAVNSPADFMFGKKLIAARRSVDPRHLADAGVALPDTLRRP